MTVFTIYIPLNLTLLPSNIMPRLYNYSSSFMVAKQLEIAYRLDSQLPHLIAVRSKYLCD